MTNEAPIDQQFIVLCDDAVEDPRVFGAWDTKEEASTWLDDAHCIFADEDERGADSLCDRSIRAVAHWILPVIESA